MRTLFSSHSPHHATAWLLGASLLALSAFGCNGEQSRSTGPVASGTDTGAVEGTVQLQDRSDHSGIIVTAGSDRATKTDESGSFRLEDVPVGERVVEASTSGFQSRQTLVEVSADSAANVEWTLEPVSSSENRPPQLASLSAPRTTLSPGSSIEVTASASDPDGDELTYSWSASGNYQIQKSSDAPSVAEVTVPDEAGTSGSIQVTIEDGNGGGTSASLQLTTSTNASPTIASLSASPPQLERGGTATLTASASDADGGDLSYDWTVASDDWTIEGEGDSVTLRAPDQYGASTTVTLKVEDGRGGTATATLSVATIRSAGSPVVSSLTASPSTVASGGTIQLQVSASDPNGGSLSYTWQAPKDWSLQSNGASAQLQAPDRPDERASVSVTVESDASGKTASASVLVSTRANRAPIVSNLTATPNPVEPGAKTTLRVEATDPDGDSLNYTWTEPSDWNRESNSGSTLVLKAPSSYGTSGTVDLAVGDGRTETKVSLTLSTIDNLDPVISNVSARPTPVSTGGTVDLTASASDPNGDSPTYTWSVADSAWSLQTTKGRSSSLDAPDQAGASTQVTLTVRDGSGGEATATLSVSTLDCASGRANCDRSATNGCETNLTSDTSHCGACGQSCSSGPRASAICLGGSCALRCQSGFANCDNNLSNGCEVDPSSNDQHCGSCGNRCGSPPNATSSCQSGQCKIECKPGFANCDGRAANGCEVDLSSNDTHCGTCGNTCESASNGDRVCQGGTCQLTCKKGFADCDGNPANGCEPANSGSSNRCPGRSCLTINKAGYGKKDGTYWIDPDGGKTGDAFQAYCDMTTDGGGWTLLGTISGSGADVWAEKKGPWADTSTFGSPNKPYRDYKSRAWFELDVSGSDILWQRRYKDALRGQVVLQECLRGKNRFNKLFTTWAPKQQGPSCRPNDTRTLKSSSTGVNSSTYAENQRGPGGRETHGFCWNGADNRSNTFKGHLYWTNTDGSGCVQDDHFAAIGIWRNGDSQYTNTDITGTNWLNGTDYSDTDISLFAR